MVTSEGAYLFFQIFDSVFIVVPLVPELFLVLCHFLHEILLFFGEIKLETIIHVVVDMFFAILRMLSLNKSFNMLF